MWGRWTTNEPIDTNRSSLRPVFPPGVKQFTFDSLQLKQMGQNKHRKYALEQHTYCTTGYELLALAGMVTLFVR